MSHDRPLVAYHICHGVKIDRRRADGLLKQPSMAYRLVGFPKLALRMPHSSAGSLWHAGTTAQTTAMTALETSDFTPPLPAAQSLSLFCLEEVRLQTLRVTAPRGWT